MSPAALKNSRAASTRWKRKQKALPNGRKQFRVASKKWWDAHGRDATYKHKYGISAAEFDARVAAQGNKCPIGNHEFGPIGRAGNAPALDHDHKTGKHRGVICRTHNGALGGFHDSIEELEAALRYMKKYHGEKS